jgi:hypothetical protein
MSEHVKTDSTYLAYLAGCEYRFCLCTDHTQAPFVGELYLAFVQYRQQAVPQSYIWQYIG